MLNISFTKLIAKNINCLIIFLTLLVCVLTFLCASRICKAKKSEIYKKDDVLDGDVFTFNVVCIDDENYKDSESKVYKKDDVLDGADFAFNDDYIDDDDCDNSKNLTEFSYNDSSKLYCPFMQDLYDPNKFLDKEKKRSNRDSGFYEETSLDINNKFTCEGVIASDIACNSVEGGHVRL